jgi:hypothetical protein
MLAQCTPFSGIAIDGYAWVNKRVKKRNVSNGWCPPFPGVVADWVGIAEYKG